MEGPVGPHRQPILSAAIFGDQVCHGIPVAFNYSLALAIG
jgi:hypothetical protein